MKITSIICFVFILFACQEQNQTNEPSTFIVQNEENNTYKIKKSGKNIKERFPVPNDFTRVNVETNSFGDFLRNFSLKEHGTKVKYFNGEEKYNNVYHAVLDIDVGKRDLQQCADAVMRLRAEHLFKQQEFDKIHFNFTNGFQVDYTKWKAGNRMVVSGNKTYWKKSAQPNDSHQSFRKYMDLIFTYAGTLSLSKELKTVSMEDIKIGDVFIQGGSPGHAVIVVDLVKNDKTGEKRFLLAQSYMPAQDMQVLKNFNNKNQSPWYSNLTKGRIETPEWTFYPNNLKRFEE